MWGEEEKIVLIFIICVIPYFPLSKDMSLCLELRFSLPESKVTPCWLPP